MPVQVPRLARFAPQAPTSVGRIETDLPDATRAVAQTSQALGNLGEGVVDAMAKQEDAASQIVANAAANEFERAYAPELERAKKWEGEPSLVYSELDEKTKGLKDEILKKYENASVRTKQFIERELAQKTGQLYNKRSIDEALQQFNYSDKVTKESVTLVKNGALSDIEQVDAKDPKSFDGLRGRLARIRELHMQHGENVGFSYEMLQNAMVKDQSEVIQQVVTTLNATGKTDEAGFVMDEYKALLTAKDKMDLLKHKEKSEIHSSAVQKADEVFHLDSKAAFQELDKIQNPSVRQEAKDIYTKNVKHMNDLKELKQKQTFEATAARIIKQGYTSETQVRNDPAYMALRDDSINNSQRKALLNLAEPRETSDPVKAQEIFDMGFDNKFAGMSIGEVQEKTQYLNKTDTTTVMSMWRDQNDPSKRTETTRVNYAGKRLRELVFKMKPTTQYRKSEKEAYANYQADFIQNVLPDITPNMSYSDLDRIVTRYVNDRVAEKTFSLTDEERRPIRKPFEPKPTPPPSTPAAPSKKTSDADKLEWDRKFRATYGRGPKTGKEFLDFVKSGGKK